MRTAFEAVLKRKQEYFEKQAWGHTLSSERNTAFQTITSALHSYARHVDIKQYFKTWVCRVRSLCIMLHYQGFTIGAHIET